MPLSSQRAPIYKVMKYWGKKPHNIWSTYIERYCPPDGLVLDPFVGSGIAAFESAKLGRHCVAFDLNPLSGFFIEVLATPFNEKAFRSAFESIRVKVAADPVYKQHFHCSYKRESALVYNYRWISGRVSEVVLQTESGVKARIRARPTDLAKIGEFSKITFPHWFPKDKFPKTPSINHKFIKDLGGDSFKDLWTPRNLYLLSLLFAEINGVTCQAVRLQLLSAFIQTLHLTCRMVYPRSSASNRDFSGSWGRADYMIRRKSMEQNPLVIFERSCIGRQGVIAGLKDAHRHFPNGVSIADITKTRRLRRQPLINYGTVDVANLHRYLPTKGL